MLQVFIIGPIAITIGYWIQRGTEIETGARVEIRRVEYETIPGAAPGVAGLRLLPVSSGVWRADLFRNQDGEVIYHYHPRFADGDVGERHLDDRLTSDPVGWTMERLADLPTLLAESGASDVADDVRQAQVDLFLPAIRTAIEMSFDPPSQPMADGRPSGG